MEEQNYFLYIVNANHPDGLFAAGDYGVGLTPMSPGIEDCRYGTMYVVPAKYVKRYRPGAETIRRAVLEFYLGR